MSKSNHFLPLLRLLLYLSLFGFTLEPRPLRTRYQPPKTFLNHIEFHNVKRVRDHLSIHPAGRTHYKIKIIDNSTSEQLSREGKQSNKKAVSNNNHSSNQNCSHSGGSSSKRQSSPTNESETKGPNSAEFSLPPGSGSNTAKFPPVDDSHIFWETSLLVPAMPEEVRREVDLLLSDLVVRLKQLLFNSLLCAYYVGFIPVQFSDVSTFVAAVKKNAL